MRIYIASSWKNEERVLNMAISLRAVGHQVDCFADSSTGRYVFHFSEIEDAHRLDAQSFLQDPRAQWAFREDKKWLDWCNCIIVVLPAGRSAHLEAGYAKGQGKKLILYHPIMFPRGEFDVMYGFADLLTSSTSEIENWIHMVEDSRR